MSSNNGDGQNKNNKKKHRISTGNPLVDIGLTVAVAAGAWITANITHKVLESYTEEMAKDVAVAENNKEGVE